MSVCPKAVSVMCNDEEWYACMKEGTVKLTRGVGLASILKMMSQGSMRGSQAATTWLKDQMELRKPMYACTHHHKLRHTGPPDALCPDMLKHCMHPTCIQ